MTQPNSPKPDYFGLLAFQGVNKRELIATSSSPKTAMKTADESNQQKIILIDGNQLANLAIEYNPGVQVNKTIGIKSNGKQLSAYSLEPLAND